MKSSTRSVGLAMAVMLLLGGSQSMAQQTLQVRVRRWLEIRQLSGNVTRGHGTTTYPAKIGDRLEVIGDTITTGKNSSATLVVDTGIGSISLSENTKLRVQQLDFSPDNGRITRLQATGGQARLRVRRFTHRGSKLEIQTPAGVSGVRGTNFGVGIQPSGKTGLAVLEGKVASAAQGKAVSVPSGYQNFTIPGEVPSTPTPLKEDTRIYEYRFQQLIENGIRKVRLYGKVDPVNSVIVEGTPQTTNRDGQFSSALKVLPNALKIQVVVITPLGKREVHELAYR